MVNFKTDVNAKEVEFQIPTNDINIPDVVKKQIKELKKDSDALYNDINNGLKVSKENINKVVNDTVSVGEWAINAINENKAVIMPSLEEATKLANKTLGKAVTAVNLANEAIDYYGYEQDFQEAYLANLSEKETNQKVGLKMIKDGIDSMYYGAIGGAVAGGIATAGIGGVGALPGFLAGSLFGAARALIGLSLYYGDQYNGFPAPMNYTGWIKDFGNVAGNKEVYGLPDPLAIDLDGDGLETVSKDDSTAYFDLDKNGIAQKTGWIKGDDGIFVRDINNDGVINDGSELFGDTTKISSGGGTASTGYQALGDLDSNKDGKITAEDEAFDELKVWQDKNQDGISQSDEMMSFFITTEYTKVI